MKKILSLMLAVLMLLAALTSCIATETPSADTTTSETDDGTKEYNDDVKLSNGSVAEYKIVRPEFTTTRVIECLTKVRNAYKEISGGVELTVDMDWVKRGTDTAPIKEILIGYTNREETRTVMDKIGFDDYAIEAVGNKIVIAAHTPERLEEATEKFCQESLQFKADESGVQSMFFVKGMHFKSDRELLFGEDNSIEKYVVVCDLFNSAYNKAANKFVETIKKNYKIDLKISDELNDATEYEILIGKSKRLVSKEVLNDKLGALDYTVAVSGKKLVIGGTTSGVTLSGVNDFCENELTGKYSYKINFIVDETITNSAYSFTDDNAEADGTDVRVMSFNVLSELWDSKAKNIDERDTAVVATIFNYSPDVVGLQEVTDNWHTRLKMLFNGKYIITDPKTDKGYTNYSTIAYNSEKVKMLEHGTKTFSQGNSKNMRLVTWGYFEKISTGKKFIVANTHWDIDQNGNQFKIIHSSEMADIVKGLEAQYNCPVITTGDYNSRESTEMYKNYVAKTGYTEAKYTAKKINRACVTYHDLGKNISSTGKAESIDHIFGSSKVEFLYFNILINKTVIDASDHCPIYADIKFKS